MGKGSACSTACAGTLFGASAFFAALFAYTVATLVRYTPAYQPVVCTQLPSRLGERQRSSVWDNVTTFARKECENPNAYPVVVSSEATGTVFAMSGDSLLPIGVGKVQTVSIPAHGNAVGEQHLEIALRLSDPSTEALLGEPVLQIVTEVFVKTTASINFLGYAVLASQSRSNLCGFAFDHSSKKSGHTACVSMPSAEDDAMSALEELVIPAVNDTTPVTTYLRLSPDVEQKVSQRKNLTFGCILAVSGFLAVALLVCGIRCFRPICPRRSGKDEIQSADNKTVAVV